MQNLLIATVKILGFHCAENALEMYPKFDMLMDCGVQ